jgi:hypothetical protein
MTVSTASPGSSTPVMVTIIAATHLVAPVRVAPRTIERLGSLSLYDRVRLVHDGVDSSLRQTRVVV